MDNSQKRKGSDLFLVRLWLNDASSGAGAGTGGEESHWRAKVQHVPTGKVGLFDGQASLMDLLISMVSNSDSPYSTDPGPQDANSPENQI